MIGFGCNFYSKASGEYSLLEEFGNFFCLIILGGFSLLGFPNFAPLLITFRYICCFLFPIFTTDETFNSAS